MKTIETTVTVTPERKITLQLPDDVSPGLHRVVLVLENQPPVQTKRAPLVFPIDHYGPWPDALSLRREDLYDESGR
jgi:hypothetical protein